MEALRAPVALFAMFSASVACAQPAPPLSDPTKDKVRFPSGDSFSLALPTLSVGQSDKQRMDQLTALAGGAGWKRFSRNSVVAPVAIDVKYLNGADGSRVGHSLHAAFVVHASLETLKDKDQCSSCLRVSLHLAKLKTNLNIKPPTKFSLNAGSRKQKTLHSQKPKSRC